MSLDLLGYLFSQFKASQQLGPKPTKLEKAELAAKLANVELFLENARKTLKNNPPVAVDFTNDITLILRDQTADVSRVPLLPPDTQEQQFEMYQGEVGVTTMNRHPNLQHSTFVKV